jgi:YidC/Oxa1 family membrane protein insertase
LDKKNTFIGAAFFIAAFFFLLYTQKLSPQHPAPSQIRQEVIKQDAAAASAAAPPVAPGAGEPSFTTAQADRTGAAVTKLSNSFVEVAFTDAGGAIRDVAFRKYPATLRSPDPYIFNELHASPMLAFVGLPGLDRETRYQLVSKTDTDVVYRTVLDGRTEVTRHYLLSPDHAAGTDPYIIRSETTFRNLSDKAQSPMRVAMSIGTAAPSNALDNGLQLMTESSNGKDQVKVVRSSLESSGGFLGFGAHDAKALVAGSGPVAWASVKNQFFAAILTPDDPADGVETRRIKLLQMLPDEDKRAYGVAGAVSFNLGEIPAHGQQTIAGNFYVGPKEYPRLSNSDVFRKDEDRTMDFGNWIFRLCAAMLLWTMTWFHSWTANWGIAIILTTLSLKIVFLPITLSQSRTSRRTQKVMPELKAIKEKYKDNPQKLQAATMELYKKHKINPVAGCIPLLLTLPFFWGFFTMLRSAAELRFAPFLWSHDLSAPDTIATLSLPIVGLLAINVFPLLLGAVNFFQMRVTPQPAVDNAQMKIMKFMPVMFVVFYYNWPSAIAVYSTVNGLFTIVQQLIVNRGVDTVDTVPVRAGKPTKNVTPRRG